MEASQPNFNKVFILVGIFLLGALGTLYSQCGNQLLLDSWSKRGPNGNGNWVVSGDKQSVLQTINGNPTFFVSPDSLINTTIRGSFEVKTTSDDDFIGFVFGFKGPVSTGTDYDFYLFDWKQNNQGVALEGFTLSRVNSANGSADFWGHTGAGLNVLDSKYNTSIGWADNTLYNFELTFTDSTITILIDTDTIFDITGTFQNGLFGFYNYSQAQVQYNNFTDNACPVAVNDTAEVIENGAVTISVLDNDSDADVNNVLSVHSIFSGPANGVAQIPAGAGQIIYIPNPGHSGSDSFEYIVSDGVGGQDTATVTVTVWDVTGPHALNFVGNSDFATIPQPTDGSLDISAAQDFTIEMWMKTDGVQSGRQVLFQKGDDTLTAIGLMNGKIFALLSDNSNTDSAGTTSRYDDGKWHHIAVVCDRSSGLEVFVDGNSAGSDGSPSVGPLTTNAGLLLGSGIGTDFFEGYLDEVRIWKSALLQADIKQLMHLRVPTTDPLWGGLVAYYQMDYGSGTTIYDYSQKNNAGTLSNPAWRALSPANPALSGDTFVTEEFTYPYTATLGDTCSRIFNFAWSATNGTVGTISNDSLEAEVSWDAGQVSGSVDLSVNHSNWGSLESAPSLNVTINPPVLNYDSTAICEGDSLYIEGAWRITSSVFSDTVAANGLDSIYEVILHVIPSVFNNQVAAICFGDSIFLAGAWQTAAGVYTDTLLSNAGCDSIVSTTLSVNPVYSTSSSVSISAGDSVFAGGAWQITSGIYYDSLTTVNGCDSIHATTVNVSGLDRYFTYSGNSNYTNSILYPLVGDLYTTFTFEVTYYDTNGILPPFGYPRAILDYEGNGNYNNGNDRNIIMSEADVNDTDPTDGKVYVASISALPIGANYQALVQVVDGGVHTTFGPFDYPDVLAQPDLEIFANNISFSDPNPPVNSPLTVFATVTNASDYVANNFVVHLVNQYDTTVIYPDTIIPSLAPRSSTTVSWNITSPAVDAWCPMEVSVDYTDVIAETNELDNVAIRPFINGDYNLPGTIVIYPNVSPENQCSSPYARVGVSGRAYYSGTAVPLKDSSVAGAEVTIMRGGATYKGLTNSNGYFSMSIPAPITPGTYDFDIEVTDFTLTGEIKDTFKIKSCPCTLPDLGTRLTLSDGVLPVGGSISGQIKVVNYGCDTADASGLKISQTGGAPLLLPQAIPLLAPGESYTHNFSGLTFNTPGTYSICAYADSANIIVESNESNNSDCRTIRVIVPEPDIHPWSGPTGSRFVCSNPLTPGFTIRNSGSAAAGPFVCAVVTKFNGTPIDTTYKSFAGLGSGALGSISTPTVPNALGTYTFFISCDTANSVAESNEGNNSASYSVLYKECKPDLVIANCRNLKVKPVDPTIPGPVTFEATVRNSGNDTAFAPIDVRFTIAGGAVINTQVNTDMAPGQSQLVQVNATATTSGNVLLTAHVDPLNNLDEFSEGNNSQSDNMCWEFEPVRRCGPYTVNFWERSYSVHQTAYLAVGVKVDHLYEASSVDVQFEVSGPGIVGTQNLGIATINNVVKTCVCPYGAILPNNFVFNQAGVYTFTMTVDPNNVYSECNEANNVKVVTVDVYNNVPDMRILSQYIQPDQLNPDVGDSISLNVTYENIGSTNIGQQMELKVEVNEIPLDSIKPVFGLVKNDNTTYAIPTRWASNLPGIHIVRAFIDSDNEIFETDELNNEATRAIVVGEASNLYFADFMVSNTSPHIGDTIQIVTEVANNGDVDNDADLQIAFIDDLLDTVIIGTVPIIVPHGDTTMTSIDWVVTDSATTIIGTILNATDIEYTYNDNETTVQIGAFNVSLASTDGCAGTTNGSLTATVTGAAPPVNYSWSNGANGPVLNAEPGIYTLQVTDGTGFIVTTTDTIDTIPGSLTLLPTMYICEGDSLLVFGQYQSQAGVYYDTLPSAGGCDSILRKILQFYPGRITTLQAMTICEGDSMLVFGQWRSMAGIYYDTLQDIHGCDSILKKELFVNPTHQVVLNAMEICDGDSLQIFGLWQSTAGIYYDTLQSRAGCDSLVSKELIIKTRFSTSLPPMSICDGDSALIFDQYRKLAGTYSDTLEASNGCDSVVSVNLIVLPNSVHTVVDSICRGDSLFVGGAWQKDPGTYHDVLAAPNGCDSTLVTILRLRTDSGCVTDTNVQNCLTVLSNGNWMQSTVVDPSNWSGYWPGAQGLPAVATFSDPVVLGQPYSFPSINDIQDAEVISTGNAITYFRTEFTLDNAADLSVRLLTTVDNQADIYLNRSRVALMTSFGRPNYKFPAHDIKYNSDGTVMNGFMGGDAYDVTTSADMDTLLKTGVNELIIAVRNLGKPNDRGGFSFRMDINCDDNAITRKSAVYDPGAGNALLIYPNPVSHGLTIESELAINRVRIFDLSGKLIYQDMYEAEKMVEIDMEDLAKGIYMIEVTEVGESVYVDKVTKL